MQQQEALPPWFARLSEVADVGRNTRRERHGAKGRQAERSRAWTQAIVIRPVLPRFRAHEERTQRVHLPDRPGARQRLAACLVLAS